jgi:signal peptidase II
LKILRKYASLFLVAGSVILLDQLSKYLVQTRIDFGGFWSPWPWLIPYARLVHWNNTGAAFGMFQGFNNVFKILAIIVAIAIIYYYPRVPKEDWPLRLAMGLQLGGAIGNLIDRLRFGTVTDFISVGNFAVFNVADASITVGVLIMVVWMWMKERNQKAHPPASTPSEPAPLGEKAPDSLPEEIKGE